MFYFQEEPKGDDYRHATQSKGGDDAQKKKKTKKNKKAELDDLKQEMEMVGILKHNNKIMAIRNLIIPKWAIPCTK